MPQRFLRPGITASKPWNSVSYMAQSFYVRLLTLVDDFGRYEAEPMLLRSHAFPVCDNVKVQKVEELCQEIDGKLVLFYEVEGKRYFQVLRWQERARCDKSRFPDPPQRSAADGSEPQRSAASLVLANSPRHKPSTASLPAAILAELVFPDKFLTAEFTEKFSAWVEVRVGLGKKPKNWAGLFQEQVKWLEKYPVPVAIEILSASIRNGWQGLFEPKGKMPMAEHQDLGPTKAAVTAYAQQKWGDDPKCPNWVASFYAYFSDPKRGWKKNGKEIDWKIELSEQVSKWRTT